MRINDARKEILVVEDEPTILNMLDDAFSKKGYSVYQAAKANGPFEILKQESFHNLLFYPLKEN